MFFIDHSYHSKIYYKFSKLSYKSRSSRSGKQHSFSLFLITLVRYHVMIISDETKPEGTKNATMSSPTSVILCPPSTTKNDDDGMKNDNDNNDHNFRLTPSSYHLNLESFINLLPQTIRNVQSRSSINTPTPVGVAKEDPIADLFRCVQPSF